MTPTVFLKFLFRVFFAAIVFLASFNLSRADEKVGRLRLDYLLLRPTYFSQEKEGGEFSFEDSSVTVQWLKDENFSASVKIGSVLERGLTQIYLEDEPEDELGFIEAYAQFTGKYGHVKAGLLPIPFGLNGLQADHDRVWPESLIYRERLISQSDYGFGYFTEHNRYFSELVVHNGELDHKPNDGNPWVTARWGYRKERFQLQISGQTGRSVSESTTTGSTTLGGWDRSQNAQWRFVGLNINWKPRRWDIHFQTVGGEAEQKKVEKTLNQYQFDAIRNLGPYWGVGVRHEAYDINSKKSNDGRSEESLMVFTKSQDSTSLLSLVLTKVLEEKNQIDNDQIWLQWRLTPYVK